MDSKLEAVLQILQNIQNSRTCSSGGSNSYDLFRGNADGVSSRRSSVSRTHSDPLDMRAQMDVETNRVTTHVTQASNIPYVTLSDPESVQSSLSFYDRPQGSRTTSSSSLHGSLSGGDHQNIAQLDGLYISEVGALNAPQLSRVLVPDKRQLSDVTEESLTGSKETIGCPGALSQQNSTASETDPVSGSADSEPNPKGADTEPDPGGVGTEPGPGDIELVWEKKEPFSFRRKRSQLSLDEASERKSPDEEAASPYFRSREDEALDDTGVRYTGTPERGDSVRRGLAHGGSHVCSEDERSSRDVETRHFDESARSAPTRMSAKRRPLVKANPVDV